MLICGNRSLWQRYKVRQYEKNISVTLSMQTFAAICMYAMSQDKLNERSPVFFRFHGKGAQHPCILKNRVILCHKSPICFSDSLIYWRRKKKTIAPWSFYASFDSRILGTALLYVLTRPRLLNPLYRTLQRPCCKKRDCSRLCW